MIKRNVKYLIIVFGVFASFLAVGQSDIGLHGLRMVPQSSSQNPAFFPKKTSFVMGIPLLSGVSARFSNSAFSFDDLFRKSNESDSLFLDLRPIYQKKSRVNDAFATLDNDVISLGFKAGKSFITLGVKQRFTLQVNYSDDLLRLLWEGNAPYIGSTLDLSHSMVNEMHFSDYYANMAIKAGEAVNIGFRINLLQGLSNVSFERSNLYLATLNDPHSAYRIQAKTDLLLHTSGLQTLGISDTTQRNILAYFSQTGNTGFSLDVGIDARLSYRFRLTGSLLDLGSITWRNNVQNYSSLADSINFTGLQVDALHDTGVWNTYADTLKTLLQFQSDTMEYTTSLRPRLLIGLEYYSMDERDRLSFLVAGRFSRTGFNPAYAIGYDRKVTDHFTYKINYTYWKFAPLNFGGGLVFDFNPFQFYVMANNVFELLFPKKQRYFQFGFGLNIKIRQRHKAPPKEHEMPVTIKRKQTIPKIVDF